MDIFKFVLVGTGNIANTYAKAFGKIKKAKIIGVLSRNFDKGKDFAQKYGIENVYTSFEDIKEDYDAVIVAYPNGLHWRPSVEAMRRGKSVLTEKPLDINDVHMLEMIETAQKNKVRLGVTYQRRTSPHNKVIKDLLIKGKLGRVFGAELSVKFYRPQSYYDSAEWRGTWQIDGGGPFMQQASHNIDLLQWFFGLPEEIAAYTNTYLHERIEVEDHGCAILKYLDGKVVTITASTATKPGFDPRLEIYTEKGTIVMVNDNIVEWYIEDLPCPVEKSFDVHSGATSAAVEDISGHVRIIEDFIEAVEKDRPPLISGESARITTLIILAIYKAAKEHRWVKFSEFNI